MPVIDAQVHVYERNHPGRPWVDALPGPSEVTPETMVAAMDAVRGLAESRAGAVLVPPRSPLAPGRAPS